MDMELAKFAFQVVNALGTLAIGVWLYLEKRNDKTNERVKGVEGAVNKLDTDVKALLGKHSVKIAALEVSVVEAKSDGEKISEHDRKIAALVSDSEHGPTHHDLGLLHEKINIVDGKASTMSGQLSSIEATLRQLTGEIMKRGLG